MKNQGFPPFLRSLYHNRPGIALLLRKFPSDSSYNLFLQLTYIVFRLFLCYYILSVKIQKGGFAYGSKTQAVQFSYKP